MAAQLPDQTNYTGFIPKYLYDDFLKNKALYDQQGKRYPYHYYQYLGIPYKVYYGDPYTLIDYVDTATAVYNPGQGIGVNIPIVVGDLTPPSPDMILPGMGIEDPFKVNPPVLSVAPPAVYTPAPSTGSTGQGSTGQGSTGQKSVAAWAWLAIAGAIAYGYSRIHRKRTGRKLARRRK